MDKLLDVIEAQDRKDHGRKHRADEKYHQSLIFRTAVLHINSKTTSTLISKFDIYNTQMISLKQVIDLLMS